VCHEPHRKLRVGVATSGQGTLGAVETAKRRAPTTERPIQSDSFASIVECMFLPVFHDLSGAAFYVVLVTRKTAQAIWELIGGDTSRRVVVNYKEGGERTGLIISLEAETMVLQAEPGDLFMIQLSNILSVEVIDPGPQSLPPEI